MSLLQTLNLPPPTRLAAGQSAASASAPSPMPTPPAGTTRPAGGSASAAPPARNAPDPKRLRAELALDLENSRAAFRRLDDIEEPLKKKIAAAQGEEKAKLVAAGADVARRKAAAEKAMHQAHEDLEALDSPATTHDEMAKILARRGATGARATEVSHEQAGLDLPTKRNHDVTTTTSSYDGRKATVDKVRDARQLGVGGWRSEQAHERTESTAHQTMRKSEEKTSHVSVTGKASQETRRSVELELPDGRKTSAEQKDAKEFSAKGASHERTVTQKNFDGSSHATTTKQSIERGEGQINAQLSGSHTRTNASGTAVRHEAGGQAGLDAGKDGLGAHAGLDGGKSVTSKGGYQAGIVGGLHGNIRCKIGEPAGEPKRYPVTLTVSFGASIGGSAATGQKEGAKGSVGVQAGASEDRTMKVTHQFTEAELGDYVKALEAASKGSKVAATQNEFRIIEAGMKSWQQAWELYKTGHISSDALQRAGDSVTREETSGRNLGANAKLGPVSAGHSVKVSDTHATTATRNETGKLDVETKDAHARQDSTTVGLNSGALRVSVGTTTKHETSFGYSITIDRNADPGDRMLHELESLKTEAQYEAFIRKYEKRITLTGRTKGQADATATDTGLSIGGKTVAKMHWDHGVSEETKTDASGKLVKKTVAANAGVGGAIGPIADAERDAAIATIDGDGNASLTLTRTVDNDHNERARAKRLKKAEEKLHLAKKDGPASGALTKAAGGEEDDNATHDVRGLTLTTAELRRLGDVARRSLPAWMGACRRYQENDDWKKAGVAIAKAKGDPGTVAAEIARFIGGDAVERRETVEQFIRGGYAPIKMGKGFEFPDAILMLRADYDLVTADGLDKRLNALASKDKAKAIAECKRLDGLAAVLMDKIGACNDFSRPELKGEMLHALQVCRDAFAHGMRGYAGQPLDDTKTLTEKLNQHARLCHQFNQQYNALVSSIDELTYDDGGTVRITARDKGEARKLVHQMEDLYARWWPYYAELKSTAKQLGMDNYELPFTKPSQEALERFQRLAGL